MVAIDPEQSAGQLAFARAMRTLGREYPLRLGRVRRIGKQIRATVATSKPRAKR